MKHEIIGGQFPAIVVELEKNEKLISEAGAMSWMSSDITMDTNMNGGLIKGLGRSLSGETLFLNSYVAKSENQKIAFASSFPGRIMQFEFNGDKEIIAQKRAFLVGTEGITLGIHFIKKFGAGFFGGEGFILQKISGNGTAFLEIDGEVVEYELGVGEKMIIDQTHLAAMESTVKFDIQKVKGVKNILFGKEGLFLGNLVGPGKVWIQTMPFSRIASNIMLGMQV